MLSASAPLLPSWIPLIYNLYNVEVHFFYF
jgi:hypothetical protein